MSGYYAILTIPRFNKLLKPHLNPPHSGGLLLLLPLGWKVGRGFTLNFQRNDNTGRIYYFNS